MGKQYVMADIHGCYQQYKKALEKISFSDQDTLYVLGDCIDKGPESIPLLQDMMCRSNVFPILGNHELLAAMLLPKFSGADPDEDVEAQLSPQMQKLYSYWTEDGGDVTLEAFRGLSEEDQEYLLEYLEEFSTYETAEAGGNSYVMVHGGLEPFHPDWDVEQYSLQQLLFSRPDYDRAYFADKYTITGHTPTLNQPGNKGTIIRKNNHIAIDCGVAAGGALAVFCLDTGEEFYIPGPQ